MRCADRLRELARAHRSAADRVTVLRLRSVRRGALGPGPLHRGQEEERLLDALETRMRGLTRDLRTVAGVLDAAAEQQDRLSGRRMGGYAGAGFLGTGAAAADRLAQGPLPGRSRGETAPEPALLPGALTALGISDSLGAGATLPGWGAAPGPTRSLPTPIPEDED